ncbi:MAG: S-methyl-5'-thioinosine phosphorylase [Betaproteobacteria bacterium]|nr:MAG: S-methyl-5'-thioinosine phosphorylase [Betaproteobacteria bacterium]
MLGIIGGSGLAQFPGLTIERREVVRTPYGAPSAALVFGRLADAPVVFLARHGHGHTLPPHRINYRANLWALQQAGVDQVLAIATVGGIHADFLPGMFAVPDQVIDYTWGREMTYAEYGGDAPVVHLDFSHPYCHELRAQCLSALATVGERFLPTGTYGATQGPRLETPAEVERMARDGVDMVGMTGMPEAYLAHELGLCYATIAASVNWAAGRNGQDAISMDAITTVQTDLVARLPTVLAEIIRQVA